MTIDSVNRVDAATAWSQLSECGEVRVGMVAPAQTINVSREHVDRVHSAIAAVVGDVDVPLGIADVCPDPLVFAMRAGLPRLAGFDQTIDGGSTWRDEAPPSIGLLYAVSQITEIAERRTTGGRRLVRVVYTTRLTDTRGELVGVAQGTSIHIGGAA
ncbi:hypothetical protein CQY20_07120 [Mycolicibacterium agri]|uniref:N-terminal of MaoC-like dehydratase domain-containing protein n=1 Tax=Mycolicibacterium agri TaxID=36811 RepID=A0A2A7NA79_MYCAG|nr:hypothetical protein [Mycolicibacterium agri]PEG40693.1 hypothetical protein CQY20_07120 [Mycolicibacterium agri]GFG49374.1 hypothetical protein MAGR_08150 [Mycolicibacterium agri]